MGGPNGGLFVPVCAQRLLVVVLMVERMLGRVEVRERGGARLGRGALSGLATWRVPEANGKGVEAKGNGGRSC